MPVPAATALGTLGAVCWSVQLLPQIILNYRRHHTTGLQPSMMLLWATAGIPLGVYNIKQDFNIALQIQPQILTFLSLVTWGQCLYYSAHRTLLVCIGSVAGLGAFMGGVEVALVWALRSEGAQRQGEWPVKLMGALAGTLLCAGVGRHYIDIWRERTVRGISWVFCAIDALGDVVSLGSVALQGQPWDVLGMAVYASELVMWLGVFGCGGWFNLRPWIARRMSQRRIARSATEARREGEEAQAVRASSESASSCFRTASRTDAEERLPPENLRLRRVVHIDV